MHRGHSCWRPPRTSEGIWVKSSVLYLSTPGPGWLSHVPGLVSAKPGQWEFSYAQSRALFLIPHSFKPQIPQKLFRKFSWWLTLWSTVVFHVAPRVGHCSFPHPWLSPPPPPCPPPNCRFTLPPPLPQHPGWSFSPPAWAPLLLSLSFYIFLHLAVANVDGKGIRDPGAHPGCHILTLLPFECEISHQQGGNHIHLSLGLLWRSAQIIFMKIYGN